MGICSPFTKYISTFLLPVRDLPHVLITSLSNTNASLSQNAGHDSNVIEEIQLDLAAAQSKFGKDDVNAKNVG